MNIKDYMWDRYIDDDRKCIMVQDVTNDVKNIISGCILTLIAVHGIRTFFDILSNGMSADTSFIGFLCCIATLGSIAAGGMYIIGTTLDDIQDGTCGWWNELMSYPLLKK